MILPPGSAASGADAAIATSSADVAPASAGRSRTRAFRFGDAELAWLERERIVAPETLRRLAEYRFTGDITGYREGELYFPDSPVLTVRGRFADAVLLETLVLSILNADSAIATAAARMVAAAHGRCRGARLAQRLAPRLQAAPGRERLDRPSWHEGHRDGELLAAIPSKEFIQGVEVEVLGVVAKPKCL